jgi:polyhydroxybutyrate depolymerase
MVCTSIPKDMLANYSFPHPVSVLIINGTADKFTKYDGGYGKFIRKRKRNRGMDMASTDELVEKIVSLNSCDANPNVSNMPHKKENAGCEAIKNEYDCKDSKVSLIKVVNGGHTWPGGKQYLPRFIVGRVCRDFRAPNEIFNFFQALVRK